MYGFLKVIHGFFLKVMSGFLKVFDGYILKVKQRSHQFIHPSVFSQSQEDKEPYGPGCRDYFWLVCALLDGVTKTDSVDSWQKEDSLLDLNILALKVSCYIRRRPYLELGHCMNEDDGLVGLVSLCTSILKHNPPFKESAGGRVSVVT